MALIPCGKPKSKDNGKYKRVIERERKRMEAKVFKWFGYVSLRPHDVAQWATSLLYSLFNNFWMITICCKVSYLYKGLLT